MATTRGDAVQAAREGARFTVSTAVELFATATIEIGASAPVVAPLCTALLNAKGVVDTASRNKEELEELQKRYGDDIQRLRTRIEAVLPIMGLERVLDSEKKLDQILDRLQPRPKLAPVPKNVPTTKSWHAVPDGVVQRVVDILGGDGRPALAALTGRSGAGKTTAAASMVNERGVIHPRPGETEDDARTRLEGVRARFPDGVVWLRVGRKEGNADRLPHLMLALAKALHEDVMQKRVDAPAAGERGESYVRKIVSQQSLRCLVVADDVWHAEVVGKLRETGMWVLLTTRQPLMVEPSERVVVDALTQEEAEDVLRGAAELPKNFRLCDAAADILEICGHVAMDIAFVGRWDSLRTAHGLPKGRKAWENALGDITTEIGCVTDQVETEDVGGMEDLGRNRRAVLRAGFEYNVAESTLARKLFVMLAVLPRGHSFGTSDAAVLLNVDEQLAMDSMEVLERWAVLGVDTSGLCRMHDAYVDFARVELSGAGAVRDDAIRRWTSHISRLEVAIGFDVCELLYNWRALEDVGGYGWCVQRMGRLHEAEALLRRTVQIKEVELRADDVNVATTLSALGGCVREAGRPGEAEALFRRALEIREAKLGPGDVQVAWTLYELGRCVRDTGRPGEAEASFRRALEIAEAKLGTDNVDVVKMRFELAQCVEVGGEPAATE
eukprot:g6871.t1